MLGLCCCSPEEEPTIRHSDLMGEWNWTQTDGGIGFHIHETPESTGKTVQFTLKDDFTYSLLENGREVSSGTWQLSMEESIYSGETERAMEFFSEYQNKDLVMNGIVHVLEKDTLMLGDNYHDGLTSRYIRKNDNR